MERLDALSVREDKNGKSWFTKVGSAFPNKDGKGYTVLLDCIPAPVEGQYKLMLRTPLPKEGNQQSQRSQGRQSRQDDGWGSSGSQSGGDLDDDFPF